jgi:predicted PurR-regulated permease PerM
VIGIFLLLAVAAIAYARFFLMPVVLAFLLALVFSPVRRFLGRRGVPSGVASLAIVGGLVSLITVGITVLAVPVTSWIDDAPRIAYQLEQKLRDLRGAAKAVAKAGEQVDQITSPAPPAGQPEPEKVVVDQPGTFERLAAVAPGAIAQLVFVLVLLFFLLSSGDMFYEKVVHVMPTFKDKRRAIQIAFDIERNLSHYFFTITVINACLGIATGCAMWVLGMPNPEIFAVIGFAFNYIPYIGALAGVALTTLIGLLSFDEVPRALAAGGTYFLLTSIEGQFITPYFVGRRLKVNTVVVLLSVAFWAWLWSVVGMLVAVPLLVTIRAFCEHVEKLQPLGDFLSARGAEANGQATQGE